MKADKKPAIDQAVAAADPDIRIWLFYGQDEGGARATADQLTAKFAAGDPMARTDFTVAELRDDPSLLAAEAAAISMFGGAKVIRVDQVSEAPGSNIRAAVEALLGAPEAGNPVILTAGDLKGTSALVKMIGISAQGAALKFWQPNARDAGGLAAELCKAAGLQPDRDVQAQLATMIGTNRAIAEQEIAKFALYLDSAADDPKPLTQDIVDRLGAAFSEGDFSMLTAAVAGGDPRRAASEHARLLMDRKASVGQLRAVQRQFRQLVLLARGTARGQSPEMVVEAEGRRIFWKEKGALVRQLGLWNVRDAERALARLVNVEIQTKSSGTADADLLTADCFVSLSRRAAAVARRR
ncbi:MAG: DNA polymerase III subunit delta [Pacificimonas sp.]